MPNRVEAGRAMAPSGDAEATSKRSPLRRLLGVDELGIFAALALFFFVGALSSPYFLTVSNLTGILQNITFLGFLSIGVGLVLMAGEIDISVGSIFGLSGVAAALILRAGYPLAAAIAAGLLVGVVCGLGNGLVAQVIKVPVVVMPPATLGISRAIALALANGSPVGGLPRNALFFDRFGQGAIAQISYITI